MELGNICISEMAYLSHVQQLDLLEQIPLSKQYYNSLVQNFLHSFQTFVVGNVGIEADHVKSNQNCSFQKPLHIFKFAEKVIGILNIRENLRFQRFQLMIHKDRNFLCRCVLLTWQKLF